MRYLICHDCSVGDKLENAFLSEFTARRGDDGHRVLSPTPIVATFSGPLVAYAAWYPPGYDVADAAKHSALGFGTRIAFKVVPRISVRPGYKGGKGTKEVRLDTLNAMRTRHGSG